MTDTHLKSIVFIVVVHFGNHADFRLVATASFAGRASENRTGTTHTESAGD